MARSPSSSCCRQCLCAADSKPTLLVNSDHRTSISLDGDWHVIVDPYDNGYYDFRMQPRADGYFRNEKPDSSSKLVEYDFSKSATLKVPGDWNSQRDSLFFYEGTIWYEKDFQYQRKPNTRTYFHVGAANYTAHVWVNGQKACDHQGGYTPFDCEVTALLHDGDNFAVIHVNNQRTRDGVPTLNTDWWNYGGLTRDVSLVETPQTFIDDYSLQLQRDGSTISGWVHVVDAPAGTPVAVTISELGLTQSAATDAQGRAMFSRKTTSLQRWSPESPKLYDVELSAANDHLKDSVGFRTIEVQGDNILLNGKPVFLRGVSIHAEAPFRSGRAWSEQDAETLLGWAKELGANFVRLAHYPHDERMTRLADRMGLMVWSEVPVYWMIEWDNPSTLANATNQLQRDDPARSQQGCGGSMVGSERDAEHARAPGVSQEPDRNRPRRGSQPPCDRCVVGDHPARRGRRHSHQGTRRSPRRISRCDGMQRIHRLV